jgi:hypothetical protein
MGQREAQDYGKIRAELYGEYGVNFSAGNELYLGILFSAGNRLLVIKYLLHFEAGHVVAQFVGALLYKPEGCGLEYRLGFLFDLTLPAVRWT